MISFFLEWLWTFIRVHSWTFVNDYEWLWMIMNVHERSYVGRFTNLHLNVHEPSRRELLNDQNCKCSLFIAAGSSLRFNSSDRNLSRNGHKSSCKRLGTLDAWEHSSRNARTNSEKLSRSHYKKRRNHCIFFR